MSSEPEEAGRIVILPIAVGEWARLQAPFPLTPEQWKQMMAVLNAMKLGLIVSEDDSMVQEADVSDG